jgi:hypothetical protein
MPSGSFTCFYCGQVKAESERSDEHIIPSCIGGNRNVTLTNSVCGTCNDFMGQNVDQPFCRDFFIEGARLIAGIKHRGKKPIHSFGKVDWSRPELLSMYFVGQGPRIYEVVGTDGKRRVAVALDPRDPQQVADVKNALKNRFAGLPVINSEEPRTEYEEELANAIIALGTTHKMKIEINLRAWHAEMVKMALGLGCLTFGEKFIKSGDADLLRSFLHELDLENRDRIPVVGSVGINENSKPTATRVWAGDDDKHLLAIMAADDSVGLLINLFGKYENVVRIGERRRYDSDLPGRVLKGVAWVVDADLKKTDGPRPAEELLLPRAEQ